MNNFLQIGSSDCSEFSGEVGVERGLPKAQLSEFQQGIDRKGKHGLGNITVNWFISRKFILLNQYQLKGVNAV